MPITMLLAVEDPDRYTQLATAVNAMGLGTRHVTTGQDVLSVHDRVSPDLILVGAGLPDIHALDVCRRLRCASDVPLIVVADDEADLDRVLALELGADDVVSASCSSDELQERVKAALRRGADVPLDEEPEDLMDFGHLAIDRRTNRLIIDDEVRGLTPMETDLMWALAENAGNVVRSEDLLQDIWGYPPGIKTRTLDVHIGRLRKKLGEDGRNPRHIITVRSVGYRFEPSPCERDDEGSAA